MGFIKKKYFWPMNKIIILFVLLATKVSLAQTGEAQTIKTKFSRETTVSILINAQDSTIWGLLTNANGYPSWNSTIISITGEIVLGNKITLISTLDEKRAFTLKVKTFEVNKKMVWKDGTGLRTYTLSKNEKDLTVFTMVEKIGGGIMYPMYAKMIPSFDESFSQFAKDLKKAAELNDK